MAKQFGENFQYGKRRISAMSNDEFNKLTPKMIQDNANAELKAMIPSMQDSITDMRHFQEFMIKEMIQTIGDLLRSGLGFLLGIPSDQVNQAIQDIEHFIHGHPDLHRPDSFIGPPEEPEPEITPPPTQTILPPKPPITITMTAEQIKNFDIAFQVGVTPPAANQNFHPGELSFLHIDIVKNIFISLNAKQPNIRNILISLSQQWASAKFRLGKGVDIQNSTGVLKQTVKFLLKMTDWLST